jgi:hypothetical protein
MKITEIVNGVHFYVATVRIKRGKSTTTAKTITFAENPTQARNLLTAMYGDDGVISVSKVSESDLTEANLNQTVPNRIIPRADQEPVPRALPTQYTHSVAQKALLNQMKRNAVHVKPTIDDLRSAQGDFDAEQKRVDREYEKWAKNKRKWAEIKARNKN